eukprot:scaffold39099_cov32-Prasinocladus_malaysianus.AAC.1
MASAKPPEAHNTDVVGLICMRAHPKACEHPGNKQVDAQYRIDKVPLATRLPSSALNTPLSAQESAQVPHKQQLQSVDRLPEVEVAKHGSRGLVEAEIADERKAAALAATRLDSPLLAQTKFSRKRPPYLVDFDSEGRPGEDADTIDTEILSLNPVSIDANADWPASKRPKTSGKFTRVPKSNNLLQELPYVGVEDVIGHEGHENDGSDLEAVADSQEEPVPVPASLMPGAELVSQPTTRQPAASPRPTLGSMPSVDDSQRSITQSEVDDNDAGPPAAAAAIEVVGRNELACADKVSCPAYVDAADDANAVQEADVEVVTFDTHPEASGANTMMSINPDRELASQPTDLLPAATSRPAHSVTPRVDDLMPPTNGDSDYHHESGPSPAATEVVDVHDLACADTGGSPADGAAGHTITSIEVVGRERHDGCALSSIDIEEAAGGTSEPQSDPSNGYGRDGATVLSRDPEHYSASQEGLWDFGQDYDNDDVSDGEQSQEANADDLTNVVKPRSVHLVAPQGASPCIELPAARQTEPELLTLTTDQCQKEAQAVGDS